MSESHPAVSFVFSNWRPTVYHLRRPDASTANVTDGVVVNHIEFPRRAPAYVHNHCARFAVSACDVSALIEWAGRQRRASCSINMLLVSAGYPLSSCRPLPPSSRCYRARVRVATEHALPLHDTVPSYSLRKSLSYVSLASPGKHYQRILKAGLRGQRPNVCIITF